MKTQQKTIFVRFALILGALCTGLVPAVIAEEPQAWEMSAADVVKAAKNTAHLAYAGDGKQAAELDGALQLETYGLQGHLSEGWARAGSPSWRWRPSVRMLRVPGGAPPPAKRSRKPLAAGC